jgi:aspartate racemase
MIGIIGIVGPYASLDLIRKIFDLTLATKDQDHLPIIMLSIPHKIVDRTEFLLGRTSINPGEALSELTFKLVDAGALFIGIPCNTAHAPEIFNIIRDRLKEYNPNIVLVNMIDEVGKYIKEFHSEISKVGVLSTIGTLKTNIYPKYWKSDVK